MNTKERDQFEFINSVIVEAISKIRLSSYNSNKNLSNEIINIFEEAQDYLKNRTNDYTPSLYRGKTKEQWINQIHNEVCDVLETKASPLNKNIRYDILANKYCTIFYDKYPYLKEQFYDGVYALLRSEAIL